MRLFGCLDMIDKTLPFLILNFLLTLIDLLIPNKNKKMYFLLPLIMIKTLFLTKCTQWFRLLRAWNFVKKLFEKVQNYKYEYCFKKIKKKCFKQISILTSVFCVFEEDMQWARYIKSKLWKLRIYFFYFSFILFALNFWMGI